MKDLPLGIEDFSQIGNYYYVDKTTILAELIDSAVGKSVLFTRPRRFGKSLTLSMIECFFTMRHDYSYLFEDKKIWSLGEEYRRHAFSRPVIRLNMKDVSAPSLPSMLEQCFERISALFRLYPEISGDPNLYPYEKQRFDAFANKTIDDPFMYADGLRFLSEMLHKHTGKKAIILIDEYDTPLENAFQNGFYDDAIEFFKRLYSSSLKANEHLYFSVMTGVLQIAKESIFSELNNLSVYSLTSPRYLTYFGFTLDEVTALCAFFHVDADLTELRRYYGGYGNKEVELFNPWSILSFLDSRSIGPYWVNTGSNKTIQRLIDETPGGLELLNATLASEEGTFHYLPTITYKDVRGDPNSLFSYLVQSGYLVAQRQPEDDLFCLRIPNNEIRLAFQNEIIARNSKPGTLRLALRFKDAVMKGDDAAIASYLESYVLDSFSYLDLNSEKEYQVMLTTILAVFFDEYVVRSEVVNRYGRCDIFLLPKDKSLLGVVIEVKFFKGRAGAKKLSAMTAEALTQFKTRKCYDLLLRHGCRKNLLYAFCFDKNNQAIAREAL